MSTDADDASNWDSDALPNSTINTVIDLGTGNVAVISSGSFATANLTVGNLTAGAANSLTVNGTASLTSNIGYLGYSANSAGNVTITDASTWSLAYYLYVGDSGNGTLTISNGGNVSSRSAYLGFASGSNGTVTVDGANSTWYLPIGELNVGDSGNGTLIISNGGNVTSYDGWIGYDTGSNGTVTVDGANSTWNLSSRDLYVGGFGHSGTLTVTNGGRVTSNNGYIGYSNGVNGTATVDGANSTWNLAGTLYVGDYATGNLTVSNGGNVTSSSAYVATIAASNGTLLVTGANSTFNTTTYLYVGGSGNGTVTVANGGNLTSGDGDIGYQTGYNGMVTVDGANSTWHSGTQIIVGDSGNGTLTVSNGGNVTTNTLAIMGSASGTHGAVTVDGANSTWSLGGELDVGYSGNGTLTVSNGGKVASGVTYVGYNTGANGTATVTGANSTWNLGSQNLYVADSGNGSLTISNGGSVTSGSSYVSFAAGTQGVVTVTGANSTWNLGSGTLHVAYFGAGNLTISPGPKGNLTIANGGNVTSGTAYVADGLGTYGFVTVNGSNSILDLSGTLYVGNMGSGTLTVSNGGLVVPQDGIELGFNEGYGVVNLNTNGTLEVGGGGIVPVTSYAFNMDGGIISVLYSDLNLGANIALNSVNALPNIINTNGYNATVAGVLSGSGGLELDGGGIFSFTANNTYTGSTSISAGTLNLDGSLGGNIGNATHSSGDLDVSGNGTALSIVKGAHIYGNNVSTADSAADHDTILVTNSSSILYGSGTFSIGVNGTATLTVSNGGNVTSGAGYLGENASSSGTASVNGTNSMWNLGSGALFVGDSGNGTLTVSNAGNVTSGAGYLGYAAGAIGTVTVVGANSKWSLGSLYVGESGNGSLTVSNAGSVISSVLYVGDSGNGTLTVANAGNVTGGAGYLGYNTGANGTVTVDGANTKWNLGLNDLDVGDSGNATLSLTGTAKITGGALYIGNSTGGVGTVSVSGYSVSEDIGNETATITPSELDSNAGALVVGNSGNGTLTLTNLGYVVVNGADANGIGMAIGANANSFGTVTLTGYLDFEDQANNIYAYDSAEIDVNTGALVVGGAGNGSLSLSNSSFIYAQGEDGANISLYVGNATGGNGTVLMTDGAELSVGNYDSNVGAAIVGNSGTGNLTITGLSDVSIYGYDANGVGLTIGANANSTGTVTVTDNDGSYNTSELTIEDGALIVGASGNGTLTLTNGGRVNVYGADAIGIGLYLGENANSTGTVTVSDVYGDGEEQTNLNIEDGGLVVGGSGTGSLVVTNGGYVSTDGYDGNEIGMYIGQNANSTGMVTVTDVANIDSSYTQSELQINEEGALMVGGDGNGTLTVSNGGEVRADGADYDYNDVGMYIGGNSAANVTVTGVANFDDRAYQSELDVDEGALVVGFNGTGNLAVSNGGYVYSDSSDNNEVGLYIGYNANTTGNMTVADVETISGYQSELEVDSGATIVGYNGTGTLTVANGGYAYLDGEDESGIGLYIGLNANSTGNVTVTGVEPISGEQSLMDVYGGATVVGGDGNGTLTVSNGGDVYLDSQDYNGISLYIGENANSTGNVTVTGFDSNSGDRSEMEAPYSHYSGPGAAVVGYNGTGSLTVANGGYVDLESSDGNNIGLYIGANANSIGTVTVTDVANIDSAKIPSELQVSNGTLVVGYSGTGTLTVANGGLVVADYGVVLGENDGSSGEVDLNTNGTLEVGNTDGIAAGTGNYAFILDGGKIRVVGSDLSAGLDITLNATNALPDIIDTNGLNATFSGILSGNGTLQKDGTGILTLTADNTYSGGTVIDAGLIDFTTASNFGTGSITLSGGGLQWAEGSTADISAYISISGGNNGLNVFDTNGSNITFSAAVLTGNGELVKADSSGNGILTLVNAETYNGVYNGSADSSYVGSTTIITGGALQLGNGTASGSVIGNITDNADLIYNENGDTIFANNISGSGNVSFVGSNTTTLSGTNSYTGTTVINSAATVNLASNLALAGSTLIFQTGNATSSGTLLFTDLPGSNATLGGLSGNKDLELDVTSGSNTPLALTVGGNGQNTTYTGVLSGNGNLIKSGSGILALTADNTYAGGTVIDGGLINFTTESNLGPGNIILSGGGLQWAVDSALDNSAYLSLSGGNTGLDTIDTNGNNLTFSAAVLTGNGELVKADSSGNGILTLVNAQTYNGVYHGSANSSFVGATTIITGGALQLGNGTTSGTVIGKITDNANLIYNENGDSTLANNISGAGNVSFIGSNTTTLSGTNSYTGTTVINSAATVNLAKNLALGGSTLVYQLSNTTSSGTLLFSDLPGGNATFGGLSGNKDLALDVTSGTNTPLALTVGGNGQNTTYSGVLSGNGSLIKSGAGIFTLTADNTYLGGTVIDGGLINFATASNFGTGSITLNGGGFQWAVGSTFDISSLVHVLGTGNNTFDTNGNDVTFATGFSGTGMFVKAGNGNLTFATDETYTGGTTVLGGSLTLEGNLGNETLSSGNVVVGDDFATMSIGNGDIVYVDNITLNNGNLTIASSANVTAHGSLTVGEDSSNTSTLLVTDANSILSTAGPAIVGDNGLGNLTVANGGYYYNDGVDSNGIALNLGNTGAGNGNLTVTDPGSQMDVAEGSVVVGNVGAGTMNIVNGGAVEVNAQHGAGYGLVIAGDVDSYSTVTVDGANSTLTLDPESGGGVLVVGGAGEGYLYVSDGGLVSAPDGIVLGQNDESYGEVDLDANGTLEVGGTNGISAGSGGYDFYMYDGGRIRVVDADLTTSLVLDLYYGDIPSIIDTNGWNATFTGSMEGGGALEKIGSGNLTLDASEYYTGGTTVLGGTLVVDGNLGGNIGSRYESSGDLYVGGNTADLSSVNGGSVYANEISFANSPGDSDTIMVRDYGSQLYASDTMTVGANGTASLTVANGGYVEIKGSDDNGIGLYIGANATATGNVTVTDVAPNPGNPSDLIIDNGAGAVGYNGTGTLTIANGGYVQFGGSDDNGIGLYVGANADSTGTVTVAGVEPASGDASQLYDYNGTVAVGYDGTGTLTEANGGVVYLSGSDDNGIGLYVGEDTNSNGTMTVTGVEPASGDQSYLNVYDGGGIAVGYSGNGTLTVANGGYVKLDSADGNDIGLYIGANANSIGNVTVTGVETNSGDQSEMDVNYGVTVVGDYGMGMLTVANGGLVVVHDGIVLGANDGSSGEIDLVNNGTLEVGGTDGIATGSGTYAITLDGGQIQVVDEDLTTSLDITLNATNSQPDVIDTNGLNATFSGILSGNGTLQKASAGTLYLTVDNTYTGGTVITSGTLQLGNGATSGTVIGNITDNANLIYNENGDTIFANNIFGSGNVSFVGSNTTTLSGTNSYTGTTVINSAATVNLASNLALGGSTLLYQTSNSGTLLFSDLPGSNATLGGLSGDKDLELDVTSGTNTPLALTIGANGQNTTYTGVLSGNGNLIKSGSGILTLTADNTYPGGTEIDGGLINFTTESNLGPGNIILSGGGLQWAMGSTLDISPYLSLSGGNTGLDVIDTNGNNLTFSAAVLTGNGELVKADSSGNGILTLVNAQTYNGVYNGSANSSFVGATTIITGGALQLGNGTTSGTVIGNITDNANLIYNENGDTTLANNISGAGNVSFVGSNTTTLSGMNSYTGTTVINSGATVNLASNLALGGSTLIYQLSNTTSSGTLLFTDLPGGNATFGGLNGSKGIDLDVTTGTNTPLALTVGGNGQNTTYSGVLSGNGSLIKSGAGILTLKANNTYLGGTVIDGGLINFATASNFGTGSITLNGGGFQWAVGSTFDISSLVHVLGTGNNTFDTNGNDVTFATSISGTGAFVKAGNGNLTLAEDEIYTGGTTVLGGALIVDGSLGGNLGNDTLSSGNLGVGDDFATMFIVNGASANVDNISLNNGNLTIASGANVSVSGNLYVGEDSSNTSTLLVTDVASSPITLYVAGFGAVGDNGLGNLTVANGSFVGFDGNDSNGFGLYIGANANSKGGVLVTDVEPNSGDQSEVVVYNGATAVGYNGTGILTVANGSYVDLGGADGNGIGLYVGANANSTGNVTVTDVETNSGNLSDLSVPTGATAVGYDGTGNLTVVNGGEVNLYGEDSGNIGLYIGANVNSTGNVTVTGAETISAYSSSLNVGNGATVVGDNGNGTLTVANGGYVDLTGNDDSGIGLNLGYGGNSTGNVTVTGVEPDYAYRSELDVEDGATVVGGGGNGTLTVANGGDVDLTGNDDNGVGLYLGYGANSTGNVTVTDVAIINSSYFSSKLLVENGAGVVGYNGTATLTVANGSYADFAGSDDQSDGLYLGYMANSTGTVTVTGVEPVSGDWSEMDVDNGALVVGGYGNGNLTVANGGVVVANGNDGYVTTYIGAGSGSNGTVLVTDPGSTFLVAPNGAFSLAVGYDGIGNLTVANGGNVSLGGYDDDHGAALFLGVNNGSTGSVLITGANSTLNIPDNENPGEIIVGLDGNGSATVANGGTLSTYINSDNSSIALSIGDQSDGNGSVLVTGAGSLLEVGNTDPDGYTSGAVVVGNLGTGNLTIANGGNATFNTYDGDEISFAAGLGSGSNGTVLVTGSSSSLNLINGEYGTVIGGEGNGTLTVANGGYFYNDGWDDSSIALYLGENTTGNGTLTVTDPGSEMYVDEGTVIVGYDGNGTMNIVNGGAVEIDAQNGGGYGLVLGADSSDSIGSVTVDGANSTLALDPEAGNDELVVGGYGAGYLTVSNGGLVTASDGILLGQYDGSYGEVDLDTNGTLEVGGSNGIEVGSGDYAFNLNGGTLEAYGDFSADANFGLNANSGINSNGHTVTVNGSINGTATLNKNGAGTLVLNADSAYPATNVNAGNLVVNSVLTSNVTLTAASAVLGGNGTVSGDVQVNAGGISPGIANPLTGNQASGFGNLTITGNLALNVSSTTMVWHLNSVDATPAGDELNVLGNLTTGAQSLTTVIFDFDGTGYFGDGSAGITYTLINANNDLSSAGFQFQAINVGPNDYSSTDFLFVNGGQTLEFEIIPEPATWGLILGGSMLLVSLRRRRGKKLAGLARSA